MNWKAGRRSRQCTGFGGRSRVVARCRRLARGMPYRSMHALAAPGAGCARGGLSGAPASCMPGSRPAPGWTGFSADSRIAARGSVRPYSRHPSKGIPELPDSAALAAPGAGCARGGLSGAPASCMPGSRPAPGWTGFSADSRIAARGSVRPYSRHPSKGIPELPDSAALAAPGAGCARGGLSGAPASCMPGSRPAPGWTGFSADSRIAARGSVRPYSRHPSKGIPELPDSAALAAPGAGCARGGLSGAPASWPPAEGRRPALAFPASTRSRLPDRSNADNSADNRNGGLPGIRMNAKGGGLTAR